MWTTRHPRSSPGSSEGAAKGGPWSRGFHESEAVRRVHACRDIRPAGLTVMAFALLVGPERHTHPAERRSHRGTEATGARVSGMRAARAPSPGRRTPPSSRTRSSPPPQALAHGSPPHLTAPRPVTRSAYAPLGFRRASSPSRPHTEPERGADTPPLCPLHPSGGTVTLIALFVPEILLLVAFALGALEDLLFPPPPSPPPESAVPRQPVPTADDGPASETDPKHGRS